MCALTNGKKLGKILHVISYSLTAHTLTETPQGEKAQRNRIAFQMYAQTKIQLTIFYTEMLMRKFDLQSFFMSE